jgi:hypothetical protein
MLYLKLCELTNYLIREYNEYSTNSTSGCANICEGPMNFANYRPLVVVFTVHYNVIITFKPTTGQESSRLEYTH